jgi:hypothetical protein
MGAAWQCPAWRAVPDPCHRAIGHGTRPPARSTRSPRPRTRCGWPGWQNYRTPCSPWRPSPARGHARSRRARRCRVPTRLAVVRIRPRGLATDARVEINFGERILDRQDRDISLISERHVPAALILSACVTAGPDPTASRRSASAQLGHPECRRRTARSPDLRPRRPRPDGRRPGGFPPPPPGTRRTRAAPTACTRSTATPRAAHVTTPPRP